MSTITCFHHSLPLCQHHHHPPLLFIIIILCILSTIALSCPRNDGHKVEGRLLLVGLLGAMFESGNTPK